MAEGDEQRSAMSCLPEESGTSNLGHVQWQSLRIRDIGNVVTGRTPSTKHEEFYGGDYNLISPADLDNGKYVLTAHKKLSYLGFSECRSLPKDTVLVDCIGNVGKLGMVFDERSATNQQINAIICNENNDPHFIYYCLYGNRIGLQGAADKTTLPIINKTNFEA
jgi:type I restriction enzyme S subunit